MRDIHTPVLIASADPKYWQRAQEALAAEFALMFAVDLAGTRQLIAHRPCAVILWSRLLDVDLVSAARLLRELTGRSFRSDGRLVGGGDVGSGDNAPSAPPLVLIGSGRRGLDADPAHAALGDVVLGDGVSADLLRRVVRSLVRTAASEAAASAQASAPPRPRRHSVACSRSEPDVPMVYGRASSFQAALRRARRAANSDVTVLLTGESGTGKEVLARWIHAVSPRNRRPFVPVDLPAIPDDLFESTLFGHERGAFTGASGPRKGKFQHACGGTLLLDEIANLKPHLQPKLLRALQEGTVEPVGSEGPTECDVRIVVATNVALNDAVRRGAFRLDLYYRLNAVNVHLPPLRERLDDFEALLRFMLKSAAARLGCDVPAVPAELITALKRYHWPGNIRELKNRAQQALLVAESDRLTWEDFFDDDAHSADDRRPHFGSCDHTLDQVQHLYVSAVLRRTGGNHTRAARILGIDRKTLRAKLLRGEPQIESCG